MTLGSNKELPYSMDHPFAFTVAQTPPLILSRSTQTWNDRAIQGINPFCNYVRSRRPWMYEILLFIMPPLPLQIAGNQQSPTGFLRALCVNHDASLEAGAS